MDRPARNVPAKPAPLPAAIALLLVAPAAGAMSAVAAVANGVAAAAPISALALAISRQVTSCADDGSAGTLRAVVATAGSGDVIDLSGLPGADPNCTTSTITLNQGEIVVPHNMTLLGPPAATLTISGGPAGRVLNSTSTDMPSAYVKIDALTITRGSAVYGGCIYGRGEVLLDHATVTGCTAFDVPSDYYDFAYSTGGGIFANSVSLTHGSVVSDNEAVYSGIAYDGQTSGGGVSTQNFTCTDSTISGNSAYVVGGGIRAGGNVTLTRCTVDSNFAYFGGGIYASGSTAQVDQSTITGNAAGRGGGIYTRSPTTIANSTIAFNTGFGSFGAGIQAAANVTMTSSIVARNHNVNGTDTDIALASGKTLSGADNLVMSPQSTAPGVIVSTLDPNLAPLGNHGGLTRTLALLAGSPAIGIGNNSNAFTSDQRGAGFAREVPSGAPDIGAYERQPIDDEIFGTGFD
jgi:hypothetical protein